MPASDDPYYPHTRLTHSAVTTADSGTPGVDTQFVPGIESAVLLCAASLTAGTATVRLKIYDGRLNAWCNGEQLSLTAGATAWKWDTAGRRAAVFVEAISGGGALTISACLAANSVAGL